MDGIAGKILAGLIQRGVQPHIAQGMLHEMQAESGLNPGINEIAPLVPGSRGGYGLNQWTGPRRRQYEAFAQSRGADPADLNTQLDFTLWELQNTEKGAWGKLQGAQTPEDAARIYQAAFLRPAKPRGVGNVNSLAPEINAPTINALAAGQYGPPENSFNYKPVMLDPNAFRRNVLGAYNA